MELVATALGWLGAIALIAGFLFIVVFYFRGAFRDYIDYRAINVPSPDEHRFAVALGSLSNSLGTTGDVIGFWFEANEIQSARLEAIQSAKRCIHFETFFMTPGRRANDFAAAVAERAAAGVEVQLVVDHYGTKKLPAKYWKRLEAAGVEVRFFKSFSWKAPFDYAGRTHRKLLLIDGKVALIGGAGISDYWDGQKKFGDTAPWFDFEFCLEGAVVSVLEGMFMQHWAAARGTVDLGAENFHPDPPGATMILVTPGDAPSNLSSSIRALFTTAIFAAKEKVWIASPYFLPDHQSRQALITAKKRGIDVRILTCGPHNDKKLVYYASGELYGGLLRAGIKIYEHQPSMLHGKCLLVDDKWVSTGSANFDPRSFFHNDELNISTAEPQMVQHIKQIFHTGIERSQLISITDWRTRPLWKRIIGRLVLFLQSQL
ncbi:MAG: phosphatidylserine/phosphatidylglycerophosphate/cardiolipin synthase family protein [Chlorogloeopsis fritschii C42_A2020_084]|uniref:phospholipase D-like domain-containing protein n=1 Tax=Chlorogloeopsis fritschii TaxID=1124 RepID=UPI0019EB5D21|nr:phosphatidylserine/phosphatidylglycerophosphate/cardiolipin synthase family protein [Chlorogloeopsis fritschii]MBF2008312.1 phosphatidylserine/phosphatidylglycerophosphate/cardiolipin synthase family protein [Chlorogloeopsis fritschii C42_A2020_084]